MVYMMHICATQCYVAGEARSAAATAALGEIAKGTHLATLAFSEKGSRSHFWAPVSRAVRAGDKTRLSALKSWVTSAGMADSYVVSSQVPESKGPTDTALYLVRKNAGGIRVGAPWDGLGLRANASSPMTLEACDVGEDALVTEEGGGFKAMLEVVLPWFCLGSAGVALGLCRASVASTVTHLKTTAFEHMGGAKLGEALPNLRAKLAGMQIGDRRPRGEDLRPRRTPREAFRRHDAARTRGQGGGRRNRHPRDPGCDAHVRRRRVLPAHRHRALLSRRAGRCRHGADGRSASTNSSARRFSAFRCSDSARRIP